VRGLPDDAPVVADAAACAARTGGRLTVVHAVPRSFAGRSVGLDGAVTHGRRLLDAAADHATAQEPGLHVERHLLRVRPYELVGEALHADLLVVGGPRTGRGATGCGLVAHSALHHAPCPVLLTPR
jgi:nucleotide-binding universal stress UspA family protein